MGAIEPISNAFEIHLVNSFIDFLRTDGIFLLRMIQVIYLDLIFSHLYRCYMIQYSVSI